MSGFSVDWLDLREPADHRARDSEMLEQCLAWLRRQEPAAAANWLVTDLGSGTGSTLRAFSTVAQTGAGQLRWQLIDYDRTLLAEAERRHGGDGLLQTSQRDLSDTESLPFAGTQLITASALFDLVSAGFIDALLKRIIAENQSAPPAFYAALNYDGDMRWTPEHDYDETVRAAFNKDQQRDKGFGPALGPDSGAYLEQAFEKAGFKVQSAQSPWLLDGTEQALMKSLNEGIAGAVATDANVDGDRLAEWLRFRQADLPNSRCVIGHSDILALP